MSFKAAAAGFAVSIALVAAPLATASAHDHWRHGDGGGLLFGLGAAVGALAVGVATIVTAPIEILAGPPPQRTYYAPAPAYGYAPPPAYAPQPTYYRPPVAYAPPPTYYRPPAYAPPPGYAYAPPPVVYYPAPSYAYPQQ